MSWTPATRRRVRRILEELAALEQDGRPLGLALKAREILPELRETPPPRRSSQIAPIAALDKGETAPARRRRVYAAVLLRDGTCTAPYFAGVRCDRGIQIDHQWGRGKAQETLENCRILCPRHHRMKTDGAPSRVAWLLDFRRHALAHGYFEEAAKAERLLALERAQHPEVAAAR